MSRLLPIFLLISLGASAGELKIGHHKGAQFRRLFSVCESSEAKCAKGKCKLTVAQLTCERSKGADNSSCTFKCNGSEHMFTGEQALSVFKAVEGQPKLIVETDMTHMFKDASVTCDPLRKPEAGICKIKHSKIK